MTAIEIDYPANGVGRLTLNRPHVLNAINRELLEDLSLATDTLERDETVRVVILRGAGRAFSAGFDLKAEAAEGAISVEEWAGRFQQDWNVFLKIWKSSKPYIAVVHGYDLGGALELSLLADITLASPAAQFGLPEIRHGGGPGAAMLPWVVGMKAAKWLMLTGQRIDARRAVEIGLVTEVVDEDELESSSLKVAGDLAAVPAAALKFTKLALNRTYERMGFLSAVDENFTISTVMNATAAYREQEAQRQSMPLKEFLLKRDGAREEVGDK
ncbi:MAG: enoyl-CoA hydratase/isomerase family protein [Acidimicrobiales bacterium]